MCGHQRDLSVKLAQNWLAKYMFAELPDPERETKAAEVAAWFSNFKEFKSHGRRVGLSDVIDLGLRVTKLEDDDRLQDAVLSVHHAFRLTFAQTPATKIIENHAARASIELVQTGLIVGQPAPGTPGAPGSQSASQQNPGSRQQRREQERQANKQKR
jgi:hypothetical protein